MQSENVINSLNKSLTSQSNDNAINEFVERIQTYIDGQKWIKKPITLSPAICSQYGWKCIKSDLLECVTCGAKLSVHEPKIDNYGAYKACIDKILSDFKANHGKHCPWPLTPSPEIFVRMILMPKEEALSQFLKRLKSSLPYKSSFPEIKETAAEDLGFSESQIMALCKMAKVNEEDANLYGKSVVPLAAVGWNIIEESQTGQPILKCNSCQRSVWCGSFSSLNSSNSLNKEHNNHVTENAISLSEDDVSSNVRKKENSEEPPHKKKRISFVIKKGEPFDPLHEHRPWCLWICNGVDDYTSGTTDIKAMNSSKEVSGIPGWKIFIKSLLRNIMDNQTSEENNSPSREQIKNVRSLLERWINAV